MKKSFFTLLVLLSFSRLASADTYVWEDYDDFSGGTLDTSKWDVGYLAGGQVATIQNGKANLFGNAYSSESAVQLPSDLLPISQGSTEGNAFLFFKADNIVGIEADIILPSSENSVEAGVYLNTIDSNPLNGSGIELAYRPNGTQFSYDYFDENSNEIDGYRNGVLDATYNIKVLHFNGCLNSFILPIKPPLMRAA